MTTYVAQIAPQRSTQYSALADALAPHELALSPLGGMISAIAPLEMGGQRYLRFDTPGALDYAQRRELGMLAMTNAFYEYRERCDGVDGPWLRPIATAYQPAFPPDLVMTRRYKGKTNELFTLFLCNVARHSSAFAASPWQDLRVFDPLAGGGTTLFAALTLGANAAGVEKDSGDVESTAAFIQQYAREQGIACKVKEERLKKLGRRWWFALGKDAAARQCVLALGDTPQSAELMRDVKRPNLIVTDLPYGIQHHGELTGLLGAALPAWAELLLPGGSMALAWDATRFPRADMIAQVEAVSGLAVLNEPPYNQLTHRVDRVIKQRDVLVARKAA
ncbi:MAG: site-specific DNA-methyltransferase [Chloroflexi bacterium]|nr:site-specific DNA-methyltransferase [Chloroflexota bacterium]MCL5273370.1 site-specific DNA-methyltransferase [Chloroflexota bacterium]